MRLGNAIRTAAAAAAGFAVGAGACLYAPRVRTAASIRQISFSGTPFDLYSMDVAYPYSIDRIVARGLADDQSWMDALTAEAVPFAPVRMEAPNFNFGCSAFALRDGAGALMGRNYDFTLDTSALLVHCAPADGFESIALCALDNLGANEPLSGTKARLACLAAPFACLDGINEKGVSIAVLTLDSAPTRQRTGKPVLNTSMAIRLVLDRAATAQEAVDLLAGYDMFASCGRDYHFYVSDASGDGRAVEYDCDDPARPMVVTPMRQLTNFFCIHKDKVLPNQKNGVYGHGRERFDAIERVLDAASPDAGVRDTAWRALRTAAQDPNPADVTSNTQWSIVFDNARCSADIALRRRWDDVYRVTIDGQVARA